MTSFANPAELGKNFYRCGQGIAIPASADIYATSVMPESCERCLHGREGNMPSHLPTGTQLVPVRLRGQPRHSAVIAILIFSCVFFSVVTCRSTASAPPKVGGIPLLHLYLTHLHAVGGVG